MKKNNLIGAVFAILLFSCGSLKNAMSSKPDSGNKNVSPAKPLDPPVPPNQAQDLNFQLKDSSLLATHTENVFGPGIGLMEIPAKGNAAAEKKSIFEIKSDNLGSATNQAIGKTYASTVSNSYFMAMATIGDFIARQCEVDMASKGPDSLCSCASEDAAKKLLQRAVAHEDFSSPDRAEFVKKFSAGCKTDYRSTISGLMSSLPYVKR